MDCCQPDPTLYQPTVAGLPITAAELPRQRERRISDLGPLVSEFLDARTEDNLDYWIDLTRWLDPGETVRGAFAAVEVGYMLCTAVRFAPTGVVVWLANGGDNVRQRVTCTIRTTAGKTKNVQFIVRTTGQPLDLTITVTPPAEIIVGPVTS